MKWEGCEGYSQYAWGVTWRVSDCEELVGVSWSSSDSVKN